MAPTGQKLSFGSRLMNFGRKCLRFLLLLIGISCLLFILVNLSRDLSLWIFGKHVYAKVIDSWVETGNTDENSTPVFRYWVSYQFTTTSGKVVTGSSSAGAEEWIGVSYGQGAIDAVYQERVHIPSQTVGGIEANTLVPVVYFPLFPEHNRLEESRLIPILACGYIPFIVLCIVSITAGRHLCKESRKEI